VEDSQLVLALLHGLNPRFSNTTDDIANSTVLPSFARAHDMLVLKEICLANDEKTIVNTTLLATASSGCTSPGGYRSSSAGASSGSHNSHTTSYDSGTSGAHKGGGGGKGKGKGKGKRGWNGDPP
jgi:hypothetical protein